MTLSLAGRSMPVARVPWVDVGRGLAIILVVAHHADIFLTAQGFGSDLHVRVTQILQPVPMPLFFAISGILAASAIRESWASVLTKRVMVFGYLFAVWSLIQLVAFKYLLVHPTADTSGHLDTLYLMGFIRPQTGIWFIWALTLYFVVARLFRDHAVLASLLSIVISLLAFHPRSRDLGLNFAQQNALRFMPFFLIPAFFGRFYMGRVAGNPWSLVLIAVGCVGLFFLGLKVAPYVPLSRELAILVLSTGGLAGGLAVAVWASALPWLHRGLGFLGANTLPIYLIHLLIVATIVPVVAHANRVLVGAIGVPFVVACAITGSLLTARLILDTRQLWLFRPPASRKMEKLAERAQDAVVAPLKVKQD